MLFAALLLAGSFAFSHNNGIIIAGRDAWTFTLQNASPQDKLEVVVYKDGVNLGKFLVCEVRDGFSCSASATPQTNDIGLWAGDVLINGVKSGDFMVWVTQNPNCEIPSWIIIQGARYPCWTLERVKTQYLEAEANIGFQRWLLDLPFSKTQLGDDSEIFPKLMVVEHPDAFIVGNGLAAGVYKVVGIHVVGWDYIEYSLKHETTVLPMVLMHEQAHKRELDEEKKYTSDAVFKTYGWWHEGHGDFLDPSVKSINHVKNWFFRRMPQSHSYYPGQVGHEPILGSPGSFPPVFPPTNLQDKLNKFSDFKYHLEQHPEHEIAACILRPQ